MSALVVVIIILAVLLVIFTLQNSVGVTVHLFFWEIANAPFVLVILGCLILGYLLATLYFYPKLWKARREYKKVLRANDDLQQHDLNHPSKESSPEISDPEGIELNDDDDSHNFFRD